MASTQLSTKDKEKNLKSSPKKNRKISYIKGKDDSQFLIRICARRVQQHLKCTKRKKLSILFSIKLPFKNKGDIHTFPDIKVQRIYHLQPTLQEMLKDVLLA